MGKRRQSSSACFDAKRPHISPYPAPSTIDNLYISRGTQTLDLPVAVDERKPKKLGESQYHHWHLHPAKRREHAPEEYDDSDYINGWLKSLPEKAKDLLKINMSNKSSQKRGRSLSDNNTDQSGSSEDTEHSDAVENRFALSGIIVRPNILFDVVQAQAFTKYLDGQLTPGKSLMFPRPMLGKIINDTGFKDEAHVRRDILPWVVPSAYRLCNVDGLQVDISQFEEQMHTLWGKCETMGSTQPKPDYVVGLSTNAFTPECIEEMKLISTPRTPLIVHAGMILPFVVCEAKSETYGLVNAEIRNLHAGAIIVRAMFSLYDRAYASKRRDELRSLCDKPIVWSIDMNHMNVNIYAHYGKLDESLNIYKLRIYRHLVKRVFLPEEQHRFIPYNFMSNIYKDFMPIHRDRIRDAISQIKQDRKPTTGLPFTASALSLSPVLQLTAGDARTQDGQATAITEEESLVSLQSLAVLNQQYSIMITEMTKQIDDHNERERQLIEVNERREEELRTINSRLSADYKELSEAWEEMQEQLFELVNQKSNR